MRITGGTFKGRTLRTERLQSARPTTDRARETVFNILHNHLEFDGARVLDICAGSGALGFESLSRGADHCVMIEALRTNAEVITTNASMLGCADQLSVVVGKAPDILLSERFQPYASPTFDLIFCDPPYKLLLVNSIVRAVIRGNLLSPSGIVVAEHGAFETIVCPPTWEHIATRHFGETNIDFFMNNDGMHNEQ